MKKRKQQCATRKLVFVLRFRETFPIREGAFLLNLPGVFDAGGDAVYGDGKSLDDRVFRL